MPAPIRRTVRASGAVAASADGGRAPNGVSMPDLARAGAGKGWSPTVVNLLVLVVLEVVAFGVIRYVFKRVTG
jgi:hypothetical protein